MPEQDPLVRQMNEQLGQRSAARERATLRGMGAAAAVIGVAAAVVFAWRRRKPEPVATLRGS
jgi:hypothetical protein